MARVYQVTYTNGQRTITVHTTANTRRAAAVYGRWKLLDELRRHNKNATKQDAGPYRPIAVAFVGKQ